MYIITIIYTCCILRTEYCLQHEMARASIETIYLLLVLALALGPAVAQKEHPVTTIPSEELSSSAAIVQLTNQVKQISKQLDNLQTSLVNYLSKERACARATVTDGMPLTLIINKTTSFSVLAQDYRREDLTSGGDNVTATLTCLDYPNLVSPSPTVVDNGDGSYQVSLTPKCIGNNLVSVSINGKTIKGMPVTVAVIPPYTSLRLKQTISNVVRGPYAIDFSEKGDAYIGGWIDHHIHHFAKNGTRLNSWRLPGNKAHGLLVHGNNVLVSQCDPPKVYNYTLNGVLVGPVFSDGCYADLVLGPDGRLYASDVVNKRISIFDMEDGSLFHQFPVIPFPRGIGFDSDGHLHTSQQDTSIVLIYTSSGVLLQSYTPPSSARGDGIFIDKAGNRLVADRANPSKLIITDKENRLLHKLGVNRGFTRNVAVAPNGDVWITGLDNNKILIYLK